MAPSTDIVTLTARAGRPFNSTRGPQNQTHAGFRTARIPPRAVDIVTDLVARTRKPTYKLNHTRPALNITYNVTKPGNYKTPRAAVAVSELMRRAASDDKNSFTHLWASPIFKYSLIALLVIFILTIVFMFWRWRRNRRMGM